MPNKLATFIAALKGGYAISNDPFDSNFFDWKERCIALEEEEQDMAMVAIANAYFEQTLKGNQT